jgi:hypothetical protein
MNATRSGLSGTLAEYLKLCIPVNPASLLLFHPPADPTTVFTSILSGVIPVGVSTLQLLSAEGSPASNEDENGLIVEESVFLMVVCALTEVVKLKVIGTINAVDEIINNDVFIFTMLLIIL